MLSDAWYHDIYQSKLPTKLVINELYLIPTDAQLKIHPKHGYNFLGHPGAFLLVQTLLHSTSELKLHPHTRYKYKNGFKTTMQI